MKHFDDDTILKFSLEILDDNETQKVKDHLSECVVCSTTLNSIEKQNKLITRYNPPIESVFIPVNKLKNINSTWLKRAAMLFIGFLLGYASSVFFQPEKVVVVEQFSISKSPQVKSTVFSVCPSVDIYGWGIDL